MTPETGLPGTRASHAWWRRGAVAIAMSAGLVASGSASYGHPPISEDCPATNGPREEGTGKGSEPRHPPAGRDPSLDKPVTLIEGAFRSGKPEPLTPLLPAEGKTFLSLGPIGGAAGYYSRDQVYFILSAIFTRRDTIRFAIRPQRSADPPGGGQRSRGGSGLVYCIATWAYHGHDGIDGESQIHFVLVMKKGAWSLVEIREAQ
ncbi:MAG TPA: hypothetical protein VGK94_04920 [Candidatus Polarisedimenticolia bacterium]